MALKRIPPLLIAALISLAALACGGDSNDNGTPAASGTVPGTVLRPASSTATPSASPTLGTAPAATATPTPVIDAEQQAKNLKLIEAPAGLLQFTADGPYVVPGDAFGVFYLDIGTQQIEGWYDVVGDTQYYASSGDNRFSVFQRSKSVFTGGVTYPAGDYLADRKTRKVYRWDGDAQLVLDRMELNGNDVASRDGLVLFRISVPNGDDWFAVYDVEAGTVVATFQTEATWALFTSDGSRIALVGEDVYVFDGASGKLDRIAQGVVKDVDLEGTVGLLNAGDDDGFLVVTNPAKDRFDGLWLRYTWTGDLVAQGSGKKVYPSPDGSRVAVAELLTGDFDYLKWYTLNAIDTSDGTPLFRVAGATSDYGYNAGNRWLADGTGLVVGAPPYGLTLAMRDGSFREFVGVPSPDSPGVFGVTGGAVDANGDPIIVVRFQGGVRDSSDPWGESGEEVRIVIPHGGHGGPGLSVSIVTPYVEEPPYEDPPRLQISDVGVDFGLLSLHDEPGSETVVGQVTAPYRIVAHEFALRCSGAGVDASNECPKIESSVQSKFLALATGQEVSADAGLTGYWARVTTEDGQEGWILLQVTRQGI